MSLSVAYRGSTHWGGGGNRVGKVTNARERSDRAGGGSVGRFFNFERNLRICERAERASLEYFHIKKCYFFQYFVGTSETSSVQMTYLPGHMYRQIFQCTDKTPKKSLWGGGAMGAISPQPPPPPPVSLVRRRYT